ncbi:MAG: NUDIX hydrolase [Patescibacteria group bacterium]|jgi:8-oxo-dGTP diphosphatase
MIHHTPPPNFSPRFHVVSCFVEHEGKILLLLRQHGKSAGNIWGAPGGKIDAGEKPKQSMHRELKEETGIMIPPQDFQHRYTVYVRYPDYDFVYHIFQARIPQKPAIAIRTEEHQEYQWLTPQDALTLSLVPDEDACIRLIYQSEH